MLLFEASEAKLASESDFVIKSLTHPELKKSTLS